MSYVSQGYDDRLFNIYKERGGCTETSNIMDITPSGYAETPNSLINYGVNVPYNISYYRTPSNPPICAYGWQLAYDNLCVPIKQKEQGLYTTDNKNELINIATINRPTIIIDGIKMYI